MDVAKIIGAIIGVGCVLAGAIAFGAWVFMLGVGVVHGEWLPDMPTIGYWSSVKVWAMLALVMSVSTLAKSVIESANN